MRRPLAWLAVCLAASWFGSSLVASPGAAVAYRADAGSGLVATVSADSDLFLEAVPKRGEGLLAFTERFCGSPEAASSIARLNGTKRLLAGVRYQVPFDALSAEYQLVVLRSLFPDDSIEGAGWRHQVGAPEARTASGLWSIAEWFTGDGRNFAAIREASGLPDDTLESGQRLLIPAPLLRPELRSKVPVVAVRSGDLDYRGSSDDPYAVYRLRAGEALYSSVVMRFTGRIFAEDVNQVAAELARTSAIDDVTDIPVGYEVKIPFDLLLPEFLPADHPRRIAYESGLSSSLQYANRVRSRSLEGITVVLDAGHGGKDVGASMGGVWESLYVYDIMVRTKAVLERETAAQVVPVIQDGGRYSSPERDVLPYSRGHAVMTDPPYPITDSRVGVNLRWYKSNSVYRKAVSGGAEPEKIVFLSIHADSIHPSLRGAMVYVPTATLTKGRHGRNGSVYTTRREVREQQFVEFSWRDRTESEGLSRQLAGQIIEAFDAADLGVHEFKPIRGKIIRGRRQFVPAVLRYNAVPAKVLVEVCNLANAQDRALVQTAGYRQRVAEALVAGLLAYYGEGDSERMLQVAATGG